MVDSSALAAHQNATRCPHRSEPSVLQQHYAEEPVADYVQAAVATAVALHDQDLPGDILIFLTGQQECESAVSMLEEEARRHRRAQGSSLRLMPTALYAGLPTASQLQAFEPTPRGYRKVSAAACCCYTDARLHAHYTHGVYVWSWRMQGLPHMADSKLTQQREPCAAL